MVDLCCKTAQSGMATGPQLEELPLLPFETHDPSGRCCWDLLMSACSPPDPGWFASVHPKIFQPPFGLLVCLLPRHPACPAASCSPQPALCCSDLKRSVPTLSADDSATTYNKGTTLGQWFGERGGSSPPRIHQRRGLGCPGEETHGSAEVPVYRAQKTGEMLPKALSGAGCAFRSVSRQPGAALPPHSAGGAHGGAGCGVRGAE